MEKWSTMTMRQRLARGEMVNTNPEIGGHSFRDRYVENKPDIGTENNGNLVFQFRFHTSEPTGIGTASQDLICYWRL